MNYPEVTDRESSLLLLSHLKKLVELDGFEGKRVSAILQKLNNGALMENQTQILIESWKAWSSTAKRMEEDHENGSAAVDQCKKNFLAEVDEEIERQELQRLAEFRKEEPSRLSNSIPGERASERLLRYETNIRREIDRTLSQLERRQQRRLGQPVPPRIEFELK